MISGSLRVIYTDMKDYFMLSISAGGGASTHPSGKSHGKCR